MHAFLPKCNPNITSDDKVCVVCGVCERESMRETEIEGARARKWCV